MSIPAFILNWSEKSYLLLSSQVTCAEDRVWLDVELNLSALMLVERRLNVVMSMVHMPTKTEKKISYILKICMLMRRKYVQWKSIFYFWKIENLNWICHGNFKKDTCDCT